MTAGTGLAAVFSEPGRFDLRSLPVVEPKRGEILVRIERTDVCGSDLHIWRGEQDLPAFGITWGVVIGHEMVGRVEALGPGVSTDSAGAPLREGDRVVWAYHYPCRRCRACLRGDGYACPAAMGRMMTPADSPPHFYGGFAQYHTIGAGGSAFAAPGALGAELLAPVNCALSQVLFGLERAALRMGDAVVVQGCGGLGLFACAVADQMGASTVIAVDRVQGRLEMARSFGADVVIDASAVTDPRERVSAVMDATGRWGADVVVEVAGTPEVVNEGIRMLARGGRYLEIGNISPRRTYKADPSLLVGQNRSILGVSLYPPDTIRIALDFLVRTQDRYPYARLVSHDFPLESIQEAFEAADAFRASTSVVRAAITPWDDSVS